MSDVIAGLPGKYQPIVIELLGRRDPELLARFRSGHEPSRQERREVLDILVDEFTDNLGPGHVPTERGVLIDDALGAFLLQWPIERE